MEPESFLAVRATEAGFMIDDVSSTKPFRGVHPLVA